MHKLFKENGDHFIHFMLKCILKFHLSSKQTIEIRNNPKIVNVFEITPAFKTWVKKLHEGNYKQH